MYPVLTSLLAASGGSNIQLDPSQGGLLPGEQVLEHLASGVGHWALLASMVIFLIITNSPIAAAEASLSQVWQPY